MTTVRQGTRIARIITSTNNSSNYISKTNDNVDNTNAVGPILIINSDFSEWLNFSCACQIRL